MKTHLGFVRFSAVAVVLASFGVFHHTEAVALGPEDFPTAVETVEESEAGESDEGEETENTGDDLFPEVDVQNPSKPNETAKNNEITFAAEEHVLIDEPRLSDVFAVGNTIRATASIVGDLFAAGQSITVDGDDVQIDGSLRLAGNDITINAPVSRNLLIFANTIHIGPQAVIEGDSHLYAASVTVEGKLMGAASIDAATVTINGKLQEESRIEAEQVSFGPNAIVQATSAVSSPNTVTVDSEVQGEEFIRYTHVLLDTAEKGIGRLQISPQEVVRWLTKTLVFSLLGVLIIILWPKFSQRVVQAMRKQTTTTWQRGALLFFLTPTAALLLMFTIIGIPIAVLGIVSFVLLFLCSRIAVGMWLGTELIHDKRFKGKNTQAILGFLVGYFILSALMSLPWVGWIFSVLAGIWGMGALLTVKRKVGKRR